MHDDDDMLHCAMVKMPLSPIAQQYSSDALRASSADAVSFAARIAAQRIVPRERQLARGSVFPKYFSDTHSNRGGTSAGTSPRCDSRRKLPSFPSTNALRLSTQSPSFA